MRRLIAILALTMLAAGCGGQEDPPASSASATPPVSTVSPTPTALTLAQAKTRYLEIVAPYNTVLEEFESAAQANKPWRSLLPLAAKVASENKAHARALRATEWPAQVRVPMAALLKETDAAQPYWERAARAKTADELAEAVLAAVKHNGSKPAGQVRSELGLPPYAES